MNQPPVARKEVVTETFYGTIVADPYRWMEDWRGEELRTWARAQAAYSRAYFDALPEREALLKRITELTSTSASFLSFRVANGRYFYMRRNEDENMFKLVVRMGLDAPETVLFDPNKLAGEAQTSIDWYFPSGDGAYVAYGISQGGSEKSELHVLEVESGRVLDLVIPRTYLISSYAGTFNWLDDNRSFVYIRFPELPEGTPEAEELNGGKMYLHRLGSDPASDPVVFAQGSSQGVPTPEQVYQDYPFLIVAPHSDWVAGIIQHGDQREITLYVAPRNQLGEPQCQWTQIADVEDGVEEVKLHGDTLYLRTHKDAPRYKVLALSLSQPDLAHATTLVPTSNVVIEALKIVGDSLFTLDLDGGVSRMRRVKLGGGTPEALTLPLDGTLLEWAGQTDGTELLVRLTSWTVSPRLYRYDLNSNSFQAMDWIPPSPVDFSEIEVHEVQAPAHDGTLIPLSIIHKKGLQLDGNNPTILMGYGSYGIVMRSMFAPARMAWYERGGVYAIAHIRGGGEYGKEWHLAGQKLKKYNTIDDFIACAEYLIAQRYTRPERLAGTGGSAGGIPTGGSLVKRPDLWAVMSMHVAVTDTMRMEFTSNGPSNIPEFGTVTTEEGFKGLYITNSYLRVQDGVNYPAVLLTTGMNDPRVVAWQATKMAARLQAATASDKPVLLRVEEQAGHGMGSTKQQVNEEFADELAFMLEQMGITSRA